MQNIGEKLEAALGKMIAMNGATLTHNVTGQSVRVSKGFLKNRRFDRDNTGYNEVFDDLHVQAKYSEVQSWNLDPETSVSVDGIEYFVSNTTTTPGYMTIWLRRNL